MERTERSTGIAENREASRDESVVKEDPVLAMLGVGSQLWASESGDSFVERLRSENMPMPTPPFTQAPHRPPSNLPDLVWRRVFEHQGETFKTARRLPFTYEVEGTGIWFYRDGKRINRKLTRTQFDVALSRCPLTSTTEIKDLMDYAYLFALLKDGRIRGQEW
jgi:hypothetical protein